MNARDAAVARVLVRAYGRDFDTDDIAKRAARAADRADVSRRQPRTITTREEVEGLPDGSVLIDSAGDVAHLRDDFWFSYETSAMTHSRMAKYLPALLIHTPKES